METGLEWLVMKKLVSVEDFKPDLDFEKSDFTGVDMKLVYTDKSVELVSELYFSTAFLGEQFPQPPASPLNGQMLELTLTPRRFNYGDSLKAGELYLTDIHRIYADRQPKKPVKDFVAHCRLVAFSEDSLAVHGILEVGLNEEEFRELSRISAGEYVAVGVGMRLYKEEQN